ncbi:MAG: hypothetical protein NXI31_17230 [bacterium]|nr:hypothetical protein [bacterium]
MTTSRSRRLLALASASVVLATVSPAQDPVFVAGDPAKLSCRIVKAEEADGYHVFEVEVTNRSKSHAEPLRFVVQGRKSKRGAQKRGQPGSGIDWFDRARMPLVARYGEGIAPGQKRRFRIHSAVPKKSGTRARVVNASFFAPADGGAVRRPLVQNLKAARGRNDFTGRTHDIAQFEVVNPFTNTADIWLRATYVKPKKEVVLLAYRVRGGQTRKVNLGTRAWKGGFDDSENSYAVDVELSKIEVVDWLQIGESDEASARKTLLTALAGWAIWPASLREARANFASKESGVDLQSGKKIKLKTKGVLRIGADRKVRVEFDAPSARRVAAIEKQGVGLQFDTEWILRTATWQLRRPPTAEFATAGEVVWMTPDSVLLRGLGIDPDLRKAETRRSDPYDSAFVRLGLRDERVAFDGFGKRTANDWQWSTTKLGAQWVLTERRYDVPHFARQTTERWQHAVVGGVPVVEKFVNLVEADGKPRSLQELTFTKWEFAFEAPVGQNESPPAKSKAAPAAPAPAGPGAATLAAAWRRIHQLDAAPVRWAADVHIVNHGTDGSWQGHDRFTAGLEATHLGRPLTEVVLDLRGRAGAETESALAALLRARTGIWFHNDLQAKGSFEAYFAGATIGKSDRKGWLDVDGHRAQRVRIRNERVTEVVWQNGTHQRFHYEDVAGVAMITRIERDLADEHGPQAFMRFRRLGERMVPERIELRAIFGKDWGPEIYTLKNVRVVQ